MLAADCSGLHAPSLQAGAEDVASVAPAIRQLRRRRSQADLREQPWKYDIVSEVVACQPDGGLRVARVVRVYLSNRVLRVFERGESEEALAGRHARAEPGVLGHHRPPSGEIRGAAIAEPAAPQAHILILGHGEFTA